MAPTRAQMVLGGSIGFFVVSSLYVSWKKEQDRKDMRIAVDKDKERIIRHMEKQQEQKE
jgi:hypothetical protein